MKSSKLTITGLKKKAKGRIPLPKQTPKVRESAKKYDRKKDKAAKHIMKVMGWS